MQPLLPQTLFWIRPRLLLPRENLWAGSIRLATFTPDFWLRKGQGIIEGRAYSFRRPSPDNLFRSDFFMEVRTRNQDIVMATYHPLTRLSSGNLLFADGSKFTWDTIKWWAATRWLDEQGQEIMQCHRRSGWQKRVEVTVMRSIEKQAHADILLLLTSYLTILINRQID